MCTKEFGTQQENRFRRVLAVDGSFRPRQNLYVVITFLNSWIDLGNSRAVEIELHMNEREIYG